MTRQIAANTMLDVLGEIFLMDPYVTLSPRAYRTLKGAIAYVKACASETLLPGVTEEELVTCIEHTGFVLKTEQRKLGPLKMAFSTWVNKVYDTGFTLAREIRLEISKPSADTPEKHSPRPVKP